MTTDFDDEPTRPAQRPARKPTRKTPKALQTTAAHHRKRAIPKKARRRTRTRVQTTTLLPLPKNGTYYSLTELSDLTDHLCVMHQHFPATNPHWRRVKARIRPSVERLYERWGMGRPPILPDDDD